jgi:hypothetical protein
MGAPLQPEPKPETTSHNRFIPIGLLAVLFLLAYYYLYRPGPENIVTDQKKLNWDDVAFIDEHGETQLKEWRTQDLERQVEELEQAEQYVLLAVEDGFYICYHCGSRICYLQKGMVWKYGVTRKGMSGRYKTKWLISMKLTYKTQFMGTYQECLIQEKSKILLYPLHHDNMVRNISERLARPPGNKNDN